MHLDRSRRIILIGLATLSLASCGSSFTASPISASQSLLHRDARFYIAMPSDARFGATAYLGSGDAVAQALQVAFMRQASQVDRGSAVQGLDEALQSARTARADYAILPIIAHWEDRATEWSGLPDRIEIIVSIHDTVSGRLINRASLSARSSMWTLGGDRPEHLLANALNPYVTTLF